MKQLKDMTLEELWQLFPIQLQAYDARYPLWYEEEQQSIKAALKDFGISRISHIGSTSVEGILSKPIIDILLELDSGYETREVISFLEKDGWILMSEDRITGHLNFNKGYTLQGFAEKIYHLHIRSCGDWDELYFRDYLRGHPAVAREYEELKKTLKKSFENDRDAYTKEKTDFVAHYTAQAREEFSDRYLPEP